MKKPIDTSVEFQETIKKMQALEKDTIKNAEKIINKTDNALVKMTMEMVRHDSEKHKLIQQMILDSILKEPIHLSPDELNDISDILNKHADIESESIALVEQAYKSAELFTTRYLLSLLIADEVKHHGLINQLNELKRASIPTSVSARYHGQITRPPSEIKRAMSKNI
ncbi:MAG: hypothetical protein LLF86_08445 [Nitrospiraceae bacterium]|nr:hypothetical protein [Nitrospiraceae bacterium]